jgi:hypothetical protein
MFIYAITEEISPEKRAGNTPGEDKSSRFSLPLNKS